MNTLFRSQLIWILALMPNLGFADTHSADLGLKSASVTNSAAKSLDVPAPENKSLNSYEKTISAQKPASSAKDLSSKKETQSELNIERLQKRGGGDAGGGHPLLVRAVSYPDAAGLDSAIAVAIKRLQSSSYPQEFKDRVEREIMNLRTADLFRYLPELILLQPIENSEMEQDIDVDLVDGMTFTSLGALTWLKPGAGVIFSGRALHYSTDELAELILHEVIHHMVTKSLSKDDDKDNGFVEKLAQSIISGQYNSQLDQALKLKIYVRSGLISRDQFWDALDASNEGGFQSYALRRFVCGKNEECIQKNLREEKAAFAKLLPKDISKMRVGQVKHALAEVMPGGWSTDIVRTHSTWVVNHLAKMVNPHAPDLEIGFMNQVKNADQIDAMLIQDYLLEKEN